MKKLIILIGALVILIAPLMSQSKTNKDSKTKKEKIDALMKYYFENGMYNGTVLVSEKGKVLYKNAFGYADPATRKPLTVKSAFYLASVSKQFTSMAIMILKEEDKLSYSDKLSKYFPEFPAYADSVTIKHLMTHTSGIPDHFSLGIYKPDLKNSDVLAALIKQEKLNFKPGEKYSYSNGAYVLLALIVEKASGIPFHTYMKDNIFSPLGMKNTLVFDESKPSIKNRAVGSNIMEELDDYNILTSGSGGIFSTVEDLFLWDQALYTEKLVSKQTLEDAFTPTILNDGSPLYYGFGWAIGRDTVNRSVSHSGSLSGYRTLIYRDITNKNAFIFLTNKGNAVNLGEIRKTIQSIINNTPYSLPKIPISNKLISQLKDGDIQSAINKTRVLLKDQPDKYKNDEQGINNLGYKYIKNKNLKDAIAIFKFNIELSPFSSNVYDSQGEAYLLNGDTTLAISNYKKSVQLNPANKNGLKVLTNLGVDVAKVIPKITVPIEVLDKYVGKYELFPNFIITVSRNEGQLISQATGQPSFKVFPASKIRFYVNEFDAQITFNLDDDGKVSSLTLHQRGTKKAKRIE